MSEFFVNLYQLGAAAVALFIIIRVTLAVLAYSNCITPNEHIANIVDKWEISVKSGRDLFGKYTLCVNIAIAILCFVMVVFLWPVFLIYAIAK